MFRGGVKVKGHANPGLGWRDRGVLCTWKTGNGKRDGARDVDAVTPPEIHLRDFNPEFALRFIRPIEFQTPAYQTREPQRCAVGAGRIAASESTVLWAGGRTSVKKAKGRAGGG